MKKVICILIIFTLINCGCATLSKKKQNLTPGLTQQEIVQLWGEPKEKIKSGYTPKHQLVEVWEYLEKRFLWFKKEKDYILIFIDAKLYSFALNDPSFAFKTLCELGVLKLDALGMDELQYQQMLRNLAEQAEKTRKTIEIIRTYQNFNTTQLQLQNQRTQQQIRLLQQQQLLPQPQSRPEKIQK